MNSFLDSQGLQNHKQDINSLTGRAYLEVRTSTEISIKSFEMYFDDAFTYLETAEQRLETLFKLKEKWTLGELEVILGEYLEPDVKMLVMLGKHTR